jgi:hypothetical protein
MKTSDGLTSILLPNGRKVEIGAAPYGPSGNKLWACVEAMEKAATATESRAAGLALCMEAIRHFSPSVDLAEAAEAVTADTVHDVIRALKGKNGQPDAELVEAIGARVVQGIGRALAGGFAAEG